MKKKTPDNNGYFGDYGGRYIPETLMPLILEIEEAFYKAKKSRKFLKELKYFNKYYAGRPPLYILLNLLQNT